MRLKIMLNMPLKNGQPVHYVLGEVDLNSLDEFMVLVEECDFIMVREFYRDIDSQKYFDLGDIMINTSLIGYAKELTP